MVLACVSGGIAVYCAGALLASSKPEQVATPAPSVAPGMVEFALNSPQLSSLKVERVFLQALPSADPVNGRIVYNENLTARIASPVAGRITASYAEIGDRVKRGDRLAVLDSPDLATAEADWRKAQSDEQMKKLALDRARTLFEGDVLARKDLESAEAGFQQSHAETRRAVLKMKNLDALGKDDGKFFLSAPIAGMVADKQINPGLEIRPDMATPLFVITDLAHPWMVADVSERVAVKLRPGQALVAQTDAFPGQQFSARIDRVGLVLDPTTRRVQVRCLIDNSALLLKPEMFVRASFLTDDNRKGVLLPNAALFSEGLYSYVFVEKAPGKFEKRRVQLAMQGAAKSYIDAGLQDGEKVVTDGAFLLSTEVASDVK